jgi:glycosyltransferase involved in cell wall biosynthesis
MKARLVRSFSYLAQYLHERKYFKRADGLIAVSENDREYYRKFVPANKVHLIPNFLDEASYQVAGQKEPYIVITGNFHSFQNYFGLKWFLENVWNSELWHNVDFYVAGRGAGQALASISQEQANEKIRCLEDLEDVRGLIAKASAAIVPLWHGSGTRLKCIEAMALKTQLISTSIGAEGIHHQGSILIADEPEQFRRNILKVVAGEVDHTDQAYHVFMKSYSLASNKRTIEALIQSMPYDRS